MIRWLRIRLPSAEMQERSWHDRVLGWGGLEIHIMGPKPACCSTGNHNCNKKLSKGSWESPACDEASLPKNTTQVLMVCHTWTVFKYWLAGWSKGRARSGDPAPPQHLCRSMGGPQTPGVDSDQKITQIRPKGFHFIGKQRPREGTIQWLRGLFPCLGTGGTSLLSFV